MNGIEDRFRDAAETDMPPSRLTADAVYSAAFTRRRRRVATFAAAGLAAALVVAVVGIDLARSSHNRVAENPDPAPPAERAEETPPWLRDGGLVTAVATDADHLYAVMSVCPANSGCSYRLVGSDDAGATWSVRQENFGDNVNREVYAPVAGVLYQVQWHDNPNYVDSDENSSKTLEQRKISTDGGRTWVDVPESTTAVDAVPAGGWVECKRARENPCVKLLAFDPATARSAPLRTMPGVRMFQVENVPPAAGIWVSGLDPENNTWVTAISRDQGRTWTTQTNDERLVPVTADGVTGFAIASDTYPVPPTGPNPTTSPIESRQRVYRTGDGGRTWQPVDSDRKLPDGAHHVVQSYVARDGTHVVLMSTDTGLRHTPWPYDRYTSSDNGRNYRPGGVTGLGDKLVREWSTNDPIRTSVPGIYLAHDDVSVYRSTDGLRWTRHLVNPPR